MGGRDHIPVYALPSERDGLMLFVGHADRGTTRSGVGVSALGEPFWWRSFRAADDRLHWRRGDDVRVSGTYGFLGDPVANRVEALAPVPAGPDDAIGCMHEWKTVAESPHGLLLSPIQGDGAGRINLTDIAKGGLAHAQA